VLRGGTTGYKHFGVVYGTEGTPGQPDFRMVTIEGNTNGDGSPDGDGVYRNRRRVERNGKSLAVVVRMG